jgi:hypothetical protein
LTRSLDPTAEEEAVKHEIHAIRRIVAVAALLLAAGEAAAQSATGNEIARLPRDTEIALARSAAPAAVATGAAVLVLEGGVFVVAEEGSNGATCYVSRSWPGSLEPHCFDAEATRTILPIHLLQAERRMTGTDETTIDGEIAEGLRTGRFRLPTRPAVSYMLSGAQILFDDEGKRAGRWSPHLMIYQPYLTPADVGLTGENSGPVFVFDEGKPEAVIVVLVADFVTPELPPEALSEIEVSSRRAEAAAAQ